MGIFSKDNLLAWCIVPFDARQRSPKERAEMLQRLGIRALAYDWREKDIESFDRDAEIAERTRRRTRTGYLSIREGIWNGR